VCCVGDRIILQWVMWVTGWYKNGLHSLQDDIKECYVGGKVILKCVMCVTW